MTTTRKKQPRSAEVLSSTALAKPRETTITPKNGGIWTAIGACSQALEMHKSATLSPLPPTQQRTEWTDGTRLYWPRCASFCRRDRALILALKPVFILCLGSSRESAIDTGTPFLSRQPCTTGGAEDILVWSTLARMTRMSKTPTLSLRCESNFTGCRGDAGSLDRNQHPLDEPRRKFLPPSRLPAANLRVGKGSLW